jgi:hypothetical protein
VWNVVIGDGLFPLGICILLRKKDELDFRVGVEEVQVTACKQSIILGWCRISDANFRSHILPCSGDLNHQNEPLTPGALRLLIWQLLVAVQYMHSCHVWHRYVL